MKNFNFKSSFLFVALLFISVFTITDTFAQDPPKEVTAAGVYQDTKEGIAAVHEDVKAVVPVLYEDVKGALQSLAGPLKVGAEHVYEVLVKQQVVNAITWLVVNILVIFVVIAVWVVFVKDDDKSKNEWWGPPFVLQIIQVLVLAFTLKIMVAGFVNPEYGAIMDILDVIKR